MSIYGKTALAAIGLLARGEQGTVLQPEAIHAQSAGADEWSVASTSASSQFVLLRSEAGIRQGFAKYQLRRESEILWTQELALTLSCSVDDGGNLIYYRETSRVKVLENLSPGFCEVLRIDRMGRQQLLWRQSRNMHVSFHQRPLLYIKEMALAGDANRVAFFVTARPGNSDFRDSLVILDSTSGGQMNAIDPRAVLDASPDKPTSEGFCFGFVALKPHDAYLLRWRDGQFYTPESMSDRVFICDEMGSLLLNRAANPYLKTDSGRLVADVSRLGAEDGVEFVWNEKQSVVELRYMPSAKRERFKIVTQIGKDNTRVVKVIAE